MNHAAFSASLFLVAMGGCAFRDSPPADYREAMRRFVADISAHAKARRSDFLIVPQNGHELLTRDGTGGGKPAAGYLEAIDGVGQESLHFTHAGSGGRTETEATKALTGLLDAARAAGKTVLVTDYVANPAQARRSGRLNRTKGYLGFAAPSRELDVVPKAPLSHRTGGGSRLADAGNFLYLINAHKFKTKPAFIERLGGTPYDLLIIDPDFHGSPLAPEDVAALRRKPDGSARLVLAYLSIGEAESYRPYWKERYAHRPPPWLAAENPDWSGNFKVRYWRRDWQRIVFGAPESSLDRILAAGFDGAYLDVIDAYAYFEAQAAGAK